MPYQNEPEQNPHGIKVGDKVEITIVATVTRLDYYVHLPIGGGTDAPESFTAVGYGELVTPAGDASYYTLELPNVHEGLSVAVVN